MTDKTLSFDEVVEKTAKAFGISIEDAIEKVVLASMSGELPFLMPNKETGEYEPADPNKLKH